MEAIFISDQHQAGILIKLGGSVITDKTQMNTARNAVIDRLSKELFTGLGPEMAAGTVIVHGAGSFGHIKAHKYGLSEGSATDMRIRGASEVQLDCRILHNIVLMSLLWSGFKPVSIPAGVVARNSKGTLKTLDVSSFKEYKSMHANPVIFGDVVLDDSYGISICSGDALIYELARQLEITTVVFITNVDGVLDSLNTVIPVISANDDLSQIARDDSEQVTDVTGAMLAKIRHSQKAAQEGIETIILNGMIPDRVEQHLKGNSVISTRIAQ